MRHLLFLALAAAFLIAAAPQSVTLPACTQAQHDFYSAKGPDGVFYPTWHPQVDTSAGCVFDHEHGSNPALFYPYWPLRPFSGPGFPLFGYAASKMGMSEGNAGFKVYVFDAQGVKWMITQHFGTAHATTAACVAMHTFDVTALDPASREILLDVHTMGDFGASRDNVTLAPFAPPSCPNQSADAAARGSNGRRQIPTDGNGSTGYEPWVHDTALANVIGLSAPFTVNTAHPQTACNTVSCTLDILRTDPANYGNAARGAWRFFDIGAGFGVTGVISGTFYTDANGTHMRQATDVDAVQQYIKPGWSFRLARSLRFQPYSPGDYIYWSDLRAWEGEERFRRNPFVTGAN